MKWSVAIGLVLWVGLAGCAGSGTIGSSCNSTDACGRGLYCDEGVSGGYCTAECSAAFPCAERAICVSIEYEDQNGNTINFNRCLQPCGVDLDCRTGLACRTIPTSQRKVCFPPG